MRPLAVFPYTGPSQWWWGCGAILLCGSEVLVSLTSLASTSVQHTCSSSIFIMMSLTSILTLALVCTVAYAQRPGFAPNPWDAMYTQTPDAGTFTTSRPQLPASRPQIPSGNTGVGGNGLVDRFGSNDNDGMVFRYFNNVPIQGPEAPCIGCNYRLTNRGFVRISTVNKQQQQQVQQQGTGSYSG